MGCFVLNVVSAMVVQFTFRLFDPIALSSQLPSRHSHSHTESTGHIVCVLTLIHLFLSDHRFTLVFSQMCCTRHARQIREFMT